MIALREIKSRESVRYISDRSAAAVDGSRCPTRPLRESPPIHDTPLNGHCTIRASPLWRPAAASGASPGGKRAASPADLSPARARQAGGWDPPSLSGGDFGA